MTKNESSTHLKGVAAAAVSLGAILVLPACEQYGGPNLALASQSADVCLYHEVSIRRPSSNPGQALDFNHWARKRDYGGNGCAVGNGTKQFHSNEMVWHSTMLVKTASDTVCATTANSKSVPAGKGDWGIGRAYTPEGLCKSTTHLRVVGTADSWGPRNRTTTTMWFDL